MLQYIFIGKYLINYNLLYMIVSSKKIKPYSDTTFKGTKINVTRIKKTLDSVKLIKLVK